MPVCLSFVVYRSVYLCRFVCQTVYCICIYSFVCACVCVSIWCGWARETLFNWTHHCVSIQWLIENKAHGLAWPKAAVNVCVMVFPSMLNACVKTFVSLRCMSTCEYGCVCVCCGKKIKPAEAECDEDRQKVIRWIRDGGERNGEERICNKELWLVSGARAERHNDLLLWLQMWSLLLGEIILF